MSDKVIAITSLLLLIALLCRNWELMSRIIEVEKSIDYIEIRMLDLIKQMKGADDE